MLAILGFATIAILLAAILSKPSVLMTAVCVGLGVFPL